MMSNVFIGGGGEVSLVLHKATNQYRVIKQIEKFGGQNSSKVNRLNKKLAYEGKLLAALDHPNIVKVHEILQDENQVAMVLEYVEGKDLSHYYKNDPLFDSLPAIATIIEQILSALAYLHNKGIIHKDIKLQNIVLEEPTAFSNLKLIDFGFSEIKNRDWTKNNAGTAYYLAPEILQKDYDKKCDLWSVGILLYLFLFKEFPFRGKTFGEISDQILNKNIDDLINEKEKKNPLAIQFLKKLLERDPENRYSAKEALNDPFIQTYTRFPKMYAKDFELFKVYHDKTVMELVFSSVYVHNLMTSKEKSNFVRVFRCLDKQRRGYICNEDFLALDFNNDKDIMKVEVNEPNTGKLGLTNLIISCVNLNKNDEIRQLFVYLDRDQDLMVKMEDLYDVLEKYIDKKVLEQIKTQFKKLKDQQVKN